MRVSTRNALRRLEQNRHAHDERQDRGMQSTRQRWSVPTPARVYRVLAQDNLGLSAVNMALDPSQGTISQGGLLSITAGSIDVGGTWNFGGLGVTVDGLNGIVNTGTINGTTPLTLTTGGTFTNYGQLTGQDVTINGTVSNAAGALLHAGDALTINGNTTNRGTIEAVNTLTVTGGSYDNQGATTQSQGNVTFNLGGTLQNTGGSVFAGNNLTINAGAVVNDQTAPSGQQTSTTTISDLALLLSAAAGTGTYMYMYEYGGENGFEGTSSSNYNVTLGGLFSPTGSTATIVQTSAPEGTCRLDCGVGASQPVVTSSTVTFNEYDVDLHGILTRDLH